jgi:hypothetical protein
VFSVFVPLTAIMLVIAVNSPSGDVYSTVSDTDPSIDLTTT